MRITTFIVLLLLTLTGCREESEVVTTRVITTIPSPTTVSASITSFVVDQDGALVSDSRIIGLGSDSRNNPDGSITIDASALSSEGTLVTIIAPGKWPEHRLLMAAGGGQLVETFVLKEKVKAGSIASTVGGSIQLGEGFGISLPPNTIVTDEDGNPYTGPVDFYINHDAPYNRTDMLNSPGNVRAMNTDGSISCLVSYSMIDIALESPNGGLLTLDDSTPATVHVPLIDPSGPVVPSMIDLWFLDLDGTFWLPSHTATFSANSFTTSVTSNGSYNFAVPRPIARIESRLRSSNNVPITHAGFSLAVDDGYSCWNGTLDSEGKFSAWVAAEALLKPYIIDNCTGDLVQFSTFENVPQGTLHAPSDLNVDLSSNSFVASISDCSGTALPDLSKNEVWINGYGNAGGFVDTQPDGRAFVSGVGCGTDDVLIQAFTRDYKASSRLIRRSNDDLNTQPLKVCSDLDSDENFRLSIDGTDLTITELAPIYWPDNGNFNWLIRAGVEFAGEEYSLFLQLSDPATGTYSSVDANMAIYRLSPGQELGEGRVYVDPASTLELTGTAYNDTEGVFEATFSATMSLQNDINQTVEAVNLPISGSFRIKL